MFWAIGMIVLPFILFLAIKEDPGSFVLCWEKLVCGLVEYKPEELSDIGPTALDIEYPASMNILSGIGIPQK